MQHFCQKSSFVILLIATTISLIFITACGGGGGGGGSSPQTPKDSIPGEEVAENTTQITGTFALASASSSTGRLVSATAGETVNLLDVAGNVLATTTTDDSGKYSFSLVIDESAYPLSIQVLYNEQDYSSVVATADQKITLNVNEITTAIAKEFTAKEEKTTETLELIEELVMINRFGINEEGKPNIPADTFVHQNFDDSSLGRTLLNAAAESQIDLLEEVSDEQPLLANEEFLQSFSTELQNAEEVEAVLEDIAEQPGSTSLYENLTTLARTEEESTTATVIEELKTSVEQTITELQEQITALEEQVAQLETTLAETTTIAAVTSTTTTTSTTIVPTSTTTTTTTTSTTSTSTTTTTTTTTTTLPFPTQITAGGYHTCARLSDNHISCWGRNNYGQSGSRILHGSSNDIRIITEDKENCTGLLDNTLPCQRFVTVGLTITTVDSDDSGDSSSDSGNNSSDSSGSSSESGNSSNEEEVFFYTPVLVNNVSNASQVNAGRYHTCAILGDNTVQCWGEDSFGQLGYSSSFISNTVYNISNASQVSAGDLHTCTLLSDNTIQCWGESDSGQAGKKLTSDPSFPVSITDIVTATQITAGGFHTCALLSNGTIQCWGYNRSYQLGGGNHYYSYSTPVSVTDITNATQVTAGRYFTCALLSDKTIRCWGANEYGQLGNGSTSTPYYKVVSVSDISNATQISAGSYHTCALLNNRTIQCWGNNKYGQLGNGSTEDSSVPVTVEGISNATQLTAGHLHTCARLSDNTIKCWGYNYYGQLGNGANSNSDTPVYVTGFGG